MSIKNIAVGSLLGSVSVIGLMLSVMGNFQPSPALVFKSISTSTKTTSSKALPPKAAQNITYAQALTQYSSSRIQFDQNCRAVPSSIVVKSGTGVLLDNRYSQSRNILINKTNYTIAPYGFKVVTFNFTTFPQTLAVHCGSNINSAQITVQR